MLLGDKGIDDHNSLKPFFLQKKGDTIVVASGGFNHDWYVRYILLAISQSFDQARNALLVIAKPEAFGRLIVIDQAQIKFCFGNIDADRLQHGFYSAN
jgi:hypothetical protein